MPTKSNFRLTLQSFGAVEVSAFGSAATGVAVVAGTVEAVAGAVVTAGAVVAAGAGVLVAVLVVPVVVLAAAGLGVVAGAGVGGAVAGFVVLAGLRLELSFSLRETPVSRSAAACSAKGQPARAWQATRLSTKVTAQAFMVQEGCANLKRCVLSPLRLNFKSVNFFFLRWLSKNTKKYRTTCILMIRAQHRA
jgi:hypothetical protein